MFCFIGYPVVLGCPEDVHHALCLIWPSHVQASFYGVCLLRQFCFLPTLSFPWNPGGTLHGYSNQLTAISTLATQGPYLHGHCPIEESWICNFRILNMHDLWVSLVELKPWPSWQHYCYFVLLEHSPCSVTNGEFPATTNSASWHYTVAANGADFRLYNVPCHGSQFFLRRNPALGYLCCLC